MDTERIAGDLRALSELAYEVLMVLSEKTDRLGSHCAGLVGEAVRNLAAAAVNLGGGDDE